MPRHLMVRRVNDYDSSSAKTCCDKNRPISLNHGDSSKCQGNRRRVFGASTYSWPDSSLEIRMATEMTWEGLELDAAGTHDKAADYLTSGLVDNRNHSLVEGANYEDSLSSQFRLDNRMSQTHNRWPQNGEIKDNLLLASQNTFKTSTSTNPQQSSTDISCKIVSRRCDSENANPYRLLGVKKNFLQRSESLGYSRLHQVSPSKHRQTNTALRLLDDNSPPAASQDRAKARQFYQAKLLPVSENNFVSRDDMMTSAKISDRLTSSFIENNCIAQRKHIVPRKQPYVNIKRVLSPEIAYDSATEVQGTLTYKTDSTDTCNLAMNGIQRILPGEQLKSNYVPSELMSAVSELHEVNSRNILENQTSDIYQNLSNFKKLTNGSDADFFHDNKENNPPSFDSSKGQHLLGHKVSNKTSFFDEVYQGDSLRNIPSKEGPDDENTEHLEGHFLHDQRLPVIDDHSDKADKGQPDTMDMVKILSADSPDSSMEQVVVPPPVSPSSVMPPMESVITHEDVGHEEDSGRVSTPSFDQEISNPDELPPSVEIDVVGDLPPTQTFSSTVGSGLMYDVSVIINDVARQQNDTHDSGVQDLSINRKRSKSSASPDIIFQGASADTQATPDRHHVNKPMFSSTPVPAPRIWAPYLESQPAVKAANSQQPSHYPYNSNFTMLSNFPMLQPPLAMSSRASVTSSSLPGFGVYPFYGYPNNAASFDFSLFKNQQYPSFSSQLNLDVPLNLTIPRGHQIPAQDIKPSLVPIYSTVASFSAHNLFPDTSYSLPVPDQEFPLNMTIGKNPQNTAGADDKTNTGPSEPKKRRIVRKNNRHEKLYQLAEIACSRELHNISVVPQPESQIALQSIPEQLVKGVTLASPPGGARPISLLMKAKEKMGPTERKASRAAKRSKENVCDGDTESAKQRNKPELFGDKDITELRALFNECPERERFCDGSFNFQVPKIPDSAESQSELRLALLNLFAHSNLPPVPSALQHSVHALSQYPFMQHLFSLHFQGVNLDILRFGAYGLAFENIRLVELGDQKFNDILDTMSYLGDDNLLHCLVKNEKTGAMCGHVAHEIGKIRRHSKNHYPDKKWVCVFCRVQMCDMTDLERHTATHTELKPFECPQCSKKFCQKVTLTQHMHKSHSQELTKWNAKSSYICRQDGCSFSQGEEMACVRHLKQHHAQTDYIKRKNQNKWPFNCVSEDVVRIVEEEK